MLPQRHTNVKRIVWILWGEIVTKSIRMSVRMVEIAKQILEVTDVFKKLSKLPHPFASRKGCATLKAEPRVSLVCDSVDGAALGCRETQDSNSVGRV
jgi:hypothetical protein